MFHKVRPDWSMAPMSAEFIVRAKMAGVEVFAFAHQQDCGKYVFSEEEETELNTNHWRVLEERPGTLDKTSDSSVTGDTEDMPPELLKAIKNLAEEIDAEILVTSMDKKSCSSCDSTTKTTEVKLPKVGDQFYLEDFGKAVVLQYLPHDKESDEFDIVFAHNYNSIEDIENDSYEWGSIRPDQFSEIQSYKHEDKSETIEIGGRTIPRDFDKALEELGGPRNMLKFMIENLPKHL